MKREDIIYDKIMHNISHIKQEKPIKQQAYDWILFLNYIAENMLYKQNKFAVITLVIIGLSINSIDINNYIEATDDDNIYSIVYLADLSDQSLENE